MFAEIMKKPILYFFLFGLLLLKFSNGFSFVLNESIGSKKISSQNLPSVKTTENHNSLFNFCFTTDVDNENDENNCRSFSNIKNNLATSSFCRKSIFSTKYINVNKTNLKTYFLENYSKIDKPNYLSFGVLLI
jgi:hypothetical protein